MAVDYTNTFKQFGSFLQILRKFMAMFIHTFLDNDANFSKRLLRGTLDDTKDDEGRVLTATNSLLQGSLTTGQTSAYNSFRRQTENRRNGFFNVLKGEKDIGINTTDESAGAIAYNYDEAAFTLNGEVKILSKRGILGALDRAMVKDSETVLENTVVLGALVSVGSNQGVILLDGTPTGRDHTLPGDIILECTSDIVQSSLFSVELRFTEPLAIGGVAAERRRADRALRILQPYEDGQTGATIKIKLDPAALVELGDDGAMFSAHVVANPQNVDTTFGKFFVKVTRNAGDVWLIQVFSDALLTTKVFDSVTSGVSPVGASGTESKTYVFSGGTSWSFDFDKTAAVIKLPVVGNSDSDISVDIKAPRIGDKFRIPVTNDKAGQFATKIAETWPISLPSKAAPPTIDDTGANSIVMS